MRSRKVAGRGFKVRNKEHISAAKSPTPTSTFYHLYPSNESSRVTNKRKGHFESLLQVVAVEFDPNCEQVNTLDKDYKHGGVFILSKREEESIRSSMKTLNCRTNVKFQHMLAYKMELGYDLALSPNDVVSSNPGFESILGVFE